MSTHADPMSGLCSVYADPYLVATEQQRRDAIERLAQRRLLREQGLRSGGLDTATAPVRAAIGSALIRMGERLRGQPAVASA